MICLSLRAVERAAEENNLSSFFKERVLPIDLIDNFNSALIVYPCNRGASLLFETLRIRLNYYLIGEPYLNHAHLLKVRWFLDILKLFNSIKGSSNKNYLFSPKLLR